MRTYVLNFYLDIMPEKAPFHLQVNDQDRLEQDPRHWRARIKRDNKSALEKIKNQELLGRIKLLQKSRGEASLARGIKNYRERMELSRSEMAKGLGITRRALFNYEEGKRSFPGDLLEKILRRGDTELHEFFAVPSEPVDGERRRIEAQLAIALFRQCKEAFPQAEDADLQNLAADKAACWQENLKATPKNIGEVVARAINELKDRYSEEFLLDEFSKNKF